MVSQTIHQVDGNVPVTLVHASRGKQARAEPISAKYEQGKIHHVGLFPLVLKMRCVFGYPAIPRLTVWTL